MLIVNLSLARAVQRSIFQFYHLPTLSQMDGAVRAYAHAHDDRYLTCSKFNSLLTEMITLVWRASPFARGRKGLVSCLYAIYTAAA